MKILKNKFVLTIALCLTILFGAFAGFVPHKIVFAEDLSYELKVEKVLWAVDGNNERLYALEKTADGYAEAEETAIQTVSAQDNVIMLHNSNMPEIEAGIYAREFFKVTFRASIDESLNASLQYLVVNANLDGISIDTKETTDTSSSEKSYVQYFDLTDIKELQSQKQVKTVDAQGLYTFTFQYMSRVNGETNPPQTVTTSFYVLDETSYINTDNTQKIEPRVANVEVIDRSYNNDQTYANETNFFNFNNQRTIDYFGNPNNTDTIYFPTITFDATKYYFNYTKVIYGVSTTSSSTYSDNKVIVTTTTNSVTTTQTFDTNNGIVEIPLRDIGTYKINFDYVVKQYNTNNYTQLVTKNYANDEFDKSNMYIVEQENWNVVGDVDLYIFGYQLNYSIYKNQTGVTEDVFADYENGLFADVTNANINGEYIAGIETLNTNSDTADVSNFETFEATVATNQAPLFFDYNASLIENGLTSKSFYILNGGEKVYIDSNTRFTEPGEYKVCLIYNYANYKYIDNETNLVADGNQIAKVQTFYFVIENIDPELKLYTIENENQAKFDANGYTNKNVLMQWDITNQFNVLPEIIIATQTFGSQNAVNVTNNYSTQIDKGSVLLSDSYLYIITINYGPCVYNNITQKFDYSASVTYHFTIDKTNIDEIEILTATAGTKTNHDTEENIAIVGEILNSSVIASDFTVTYGSKTGDGVRNGFKPSGAKITATYDYIPFSNTNTYGIVNSSYVLNGYSNDRIDKALNYSQISNLISETRQDQSVVNYVLGNDLNSVLTDDGIYIFHFEDSAQNKATRLVVLDTTKPVVMQKQGDENYGYISGVNNIVSDDVNVLWGSHKAIELKLDSTTDSEIIENLNEFIPEYIYNNHYYVLKIANAEILSSNNSLFTTTTLTNKDIIADASDNEPLSGEKVYDIKITDLLENKNNQTFVEMNFDKSLLMAHFEGNAEKNVQNIGGDTESKQSDDEINTLSRIFVNNTTNKQKIYISWLANTGTEYEIESVVCNFYPLTFDNNSPNYPYSSSSTQTIDASKNTTVGVINSENRTISSYINLVQDERYGTSATMPGMYKVVRTYKNDISENSKDVKQRTYKFYVDRQNIISYFNNEYLVGAEISIDMQNGNKTFAGAEFLQEFTNNYVLSTNKLPVTLNVPVNKYSNSFEELRLSYFIKDELGVTVYDSTKETKKVSLTTNSTYTVTIYDNTDGTGTTEYRNGVNEINFAFKIDNTAPVVEIVNQNNVIVTDEAFNTNQIKAVWTEDAEGYKANIDQNNLTITKLLENGTSKPVYKIVNGVVDSASLIQDKNLISRNQNEKYSWTYEIDLSKLTTAKENCKFEITVQYEGSEQDYGNNFRTTKTIYFDYSAPEYNFNNLLNADRFLSNQEKLAFVDINSPINYEIYAFTVDDTFEFGYAPASSFWKNDANGNTNDSVSIWYRRYNKYSSNIDGSAMQSIIPSDPRYSDPTQAPQRLRFNSNLRDASGNLYYTEVTNRNQPFYDIVNGQEGYYEIIEMDCAGNYRIYTIALYETQSLNDLSVRYKTTIDSIDNAVVEFDAVWSEISQNQYQLNVNNKQMLLSDINLTLINGTGNNWFDVLATSNKNQQQDHKSFRVAPTSVEGYISVEELIDEINNFIAYDFETEKFGYSYSIKIVNNYGISFVIEYKTPGETFELNFIEGTQSLTVSYSQDPNSSTYLTEFYVYEAKDGKLEYTNEYLVATDSYDRVVVSNPSAPSGENGIEIYSYTFRNNVGQGRNLTFVYVDNFGVSYKVNKIIGLTDVAYENMIGFDSIYDASEITPETDDATNYRDNKYFEYYSNGIATLNYQPQIYSLNQITMLAENEKEEIVLDLEQLTVTDLSNGTRLVYIYNERKVNAHDVYVVELSDTAGNIYKFIVHYYSKLADLVFYDSSNYEYDLETTKSMSRTIYLKYNQDQFAPYKTTVSVNKTYVDIYGNVFEDNYTVNSVDDCVFSEYADYVVTASNPFGNSKTFEFTIRQSTATYFSVIVKPDGITPQIIQPSEVKYDYNGTKIDQYFTIYNTVEIDVNSSRDLVIEDDDIIEVDENTTIYHIHSTENALISYEKFIAVTVINSSNNFISDSFEINEELATGKSAKIKTKTVSITLPAYNQVIGNQIKVELYFNSQSVGMLKNYVLSADGKYMTFELNDCGVYYLYVSDIAGNSQLFGDSRYFTLYVLNDVIYKLNGEYGIYNAVFNDDVILSLEQTSQFDRQTINGRTQFISVNSTLNGKPYTPSQTGGTYIFSEYGTYVITLTGIVNQDTENPVVTTAKFSIINKNEAKVAHEYIGLNGYEVISIVKDNADITDRIREGLEMLTLNSFAVSGGMNAIGGNGKYVITVKVTHNDIIPSQTFSYEVWINNDTDALILCSLKEGDSTTDNIKLQLNLYQIYSKIGECFVRINGRDYVTINASTAQENAISVYELTANQRYNITLETNSGNTLLSFVVTKVEPLNTVAIIVIVVVSVVVIGLTVTFILLRKKMKVR